MGYEENNEKKELIEAMEEKLLNQCVKIRVWHPDLMEMFYFNTIEDIIEWQGNDDYRSDNIEKELKAVTYMKCLGTDSYGREIYQGDIIKETFEKDGETFEFIDIVDSFSVYYVGKDDIMFKKIGNIYENPELFN